MTVETIQDLSDIRLKDKILGEISLNNKTLVGFIEVTGIKYEGNKVILEGNLGSDISFTLNMFNKEVKLTRHKTKVEPPTHLTKRKIVSLYDKPDSSTPIVTVMSKNSTIEWFMFSAGSLPGWSITEESINLFNNKEMEIYN